MSDSPSGTSPADEIEVVTRKEPVDILVMRSSCFGYITLCDVFRIWAWEKTVKVGLWAPVLRKSFLFAYGLHQPLQDEEGPISANATAI